MRIRHTNYGKLRRLFTRGVWLGLGLAAFAVAVYHVFPVFGVITLVIGIALFGFSASIACKSYVCPYCELPMDIRDGHPVTCPSCGKRVERFNRAPLDQVGDERAGELPSVSLPEDEDD